MIRVVAHAVRAPGIARAADLRAAFDAGRPLVGPMPTAQRPAVVPMGAWRRMSPLSRSVAEVALEVLEQVPVDRTTLVTVWGTVFGELGTTSGFLERMFLEGPDRVSPSAFQTSLFGTPVAHLSMALGLVGPSETVSAGGVSGALAILRGIDALRAGAPAVLVLGGDDLSDTVKRAWSLTEPSPPRLGEAVGALLLQRSDAGCPIDVLPGVAPRPGPVYHRSVALPDEGLLVAVRNGTPVEDVMGSCPGAGVALAAAACIGGGSVIEQDGPSAWTVVVGPS